MGDVWGGAMHPVVLSAAGAASIAAIASEQVPIPMTFEMLAVIVASVSGVLTAREHKLDLTGAVCLAALVALGGGLIRDIILQEGNVYIMQQPVALPVCIITAAATFTFPGIAEKPDRLIAVLDVFSLGLFAVMGADKTMVYGYDPIACITLGFITAVGGGMMRDVCLAKVPYIFQRGNLYALAALAGASLYVILVNSFGVWNITACVVSTAATMIIRWLSLRYNIMSPTEINLRQVARIARPIKHVGMRTVRKVRNVSSRTRKHGQGRTHRRERSRG